MTGSGAESATGSGRLPDALPATLGPQCAHFINTYGVHGPGDVKGQRFTLTMEELAFLYQVYELKVDDYRPDRWRRRWRHGVYCRRKGLRKSELMAQVMLLEFDGPCRFTGQWAEGGEVDEWGYEFSEGEPIGDRVTSPEIPVVATTERQTEKLVWGVARYVFQHTPLSGRYTIQQDQIFLAGKQPEEGWCYIVPPTNSDAADGAKPTFIPREEPHLWTAADLKETAQVIERNLIKRVGADPWIMDATTMYAPGEESVLEDAHRAVQAGDASILFDCRSASMDWNLDDDDEWLAAVNEAAGDGHSWANIEGQRSLWLKPGASEASFRRFQLNQGVAIENRPFSGEKMDVFADPSRTPGPSKRTPIVLFLDGSLTRDATAVIAWTVEERPHLFLVGMWERPDAGLREEWTVPKKDVIARIETAMDDYLGVTLAGDADRFWNPQLTAWEETYGEDRVVHVPTRQGKLAGAMIDRFEEDFLVGLSRSAEGGETPWTYDGSPELRRHFANTVVQKRAGSVYRVLSKASEGAAAKIDGAVAAVFGYGLVPDARVRAEGLRPRRVGIY